MILSSLRGCSAYAVSPRFSKLENGRSQPYSQVVPRAMSITSAWERQPDLNIRSPVPRPPALGTNDCRTDGGVAVSVRQDATPGPICPLRFRSEAAQASADGAQPGRDGPADRRNRQPHATCDGGKARWDGVRRADLCRLEVADIDSEGMVLHIHEGKGGRDRDVPPCPKLLATPREYCAG